MKAVVLIYGSVVACCEDAMVSMKNPAEASADLVQAQARYYCHRFVLSWIPLRFRPRCLVMVTVPRSLRANLPSLQGLGIRGRHG